MLISGKNVLKEILKTKLKINKLYIIDTFNDNEIKLLIKELNIKPIILNKNEFLKFSIPNNQGIIADINPFTYTNLETLIKTDGKLIVILDHLEDPHNFGAIIRTCEAAGVDGIIIPKDRSVLVNETVIKTSAGAFCHIPICLVTNLVTALKTLKDNNYWIIGSDMDNSSNYNNLDYQMKVGLIIGSEGFGMSDLVKKACDYMVHIPMYGNVNSLNASVAAGILIYKIKEKQ